MPAKAQVAVAALLFSLLAGWGSRAAATPAFARKYGVSCSACHESWPKLNDQGRAFQDNGFQFGTGQDEPVKLNPAYWPISLRGGLGYQYSLATNQQTNGGPDTIKAGRLGYTTMHLTFAGTLAENITVFMILQPLLTNASMNPQFPSPVASITNPGQLGLIEYFWVRFDNLFGKSWLNFKAGLSELDLPFDQDETLSPLSPYLIYQYHPGGTANILPFSLGASQFTAAVEGHSRDDSTRYSLAYVQTQDDPGSDLPLASPGVYGHVQKSFELWHRRVPEITVGLMAMAGSYPTKALYVGGPAGSPASGSLNTSTTSSTAATQTCPDPDDCGSTASSGQGGPTVVPNSAYALRTFYKEGADLAVNFGDLALPFVLQATCILGQESPAFITGGSREASYYGGFVEADWTPLLNLTVGARWDFIRNIQQADPTRPSGYLDTDQGTAVARYAIAAPLRTAVALHVELSYRHTVAGGAWNLPFDGFLGFGGLDLAF